MSRYKNIFYFNMVEVALALAVIGIGISSVLVLFPVGINAGKSAIADNNIADVSEYVLGYMRAVAANDWNAITNLKKVKSGSTDAINDPPTGEVFKVKDAADGLYLFQQSTVVTLNGTSTRIPDFNAVVKLWREDLTGVELYRGRKENIPSDYAVALCMEISWPAERPEANREGRRYYRMELYK